MHLSLTPEMSSRLERVLMLDKLMFSSAPMMLPFLLMSSEHIPYWTSIFSECKRQLYYGQPAVMMV